MITEAVHPRPAIVSGQPAAERSASRWGIRKRSVLSAVVVVTFSMLVGGAFLLLVLQSSLVSAAWNDLAVRANDVARLLQEEGIEETQSTLAEDRNSAAQVQIVDEANRVVGWSIRGLRSSPMSTLRPSPGQTAKEELSRAPALGGDDDILVSARGVELHGKRYVILVAAPLEVQTDTLRTVGLLLLAAAPLPLGHSLP